MSRKMRMLVFIIFSVVIFICIILFKHATFSEEIIFRAIEDIPKLGKSLFKIAIVIVVRNFKDFCDYSKAYDSIKCYARWRKYHLKVLFSSEDENLRRICPHDDVKFMFARHCVVVNFMELNPQFDYILFLDADMGVINPMHEIEEYVDPKLDLIFYDRLYNFEIMAGSYLAKNSDYTRDFLTFWTNFNFRLPKSFHGTDNGAIHQVFMEKFAKEDICRPLWNDSKNYADLFEWQACTRYVLGNWKQNVFGGRVKVVKKGGNSWARDGYLTETKWSDQDFIFHGWKEFKKNQNDHVSWKYPFYYKNFNLSLCTSDYAIKNWSFKKDLHILEEERTKILNSKISTVRNDYEKALDKALAKLKYKKL